MYSDGWLNMDNSPLKHFPVILFPNSLEFYLNSRDKHKTLLTLYNPSTFPVRFTVQSNCSNKYTVVDSAGTIGPQCRVDLVIRHVKPTISNCNAPDKFKITMYDYHTRQPLGNRIVHARLLEAPPECSTIGDMEENFESFAATSVDKKSSHSWSTQQLTTQRNNLPVNMIAVVILIASVVVLMVPIPSDAERAASRFWSTVPTEFSSIKLVAAFFLGLTTMALLKP